MPSRVVVTRIGPASAGEGHGQRNGEWFGKLVKASAAPRRAERRFAALCADHGAVCNESIEDETGWDFVVEFPGRHAPGLPPDMRPGGLTCFVQVKSTTLARPATRVKLSNALRFANAPSPCFIVLFAYAPKGDLRHTYVLHVWRDQIARTLEAVRRAAAEGDEALHRRSLTLRFSEGDRADDPVARIEAEATAISPYAGEKAAILAGVGFEEGLGEASFTLADTVTAERFVDAQLGIGAPLDVAGFRFTTRRFGIKAGPPLTDLGPGTVHVEARPSGSCVVTLASDTDAGGFDIASDVYLPNRPDLPERLFKIRITSVLFDLGVRPHTGETTFEITVPPERRLPIRDAEKFLRLRGMLAAGDIDFQALKDDVCFMWGTISHAPFEEGAAWAGIRGFLTHVVGLVSPERLPLSAEVSLADLRDRAPAILEFMAAVGTGPTRATAADTVAELALGASCTLVHAARVDFEGFSVCASFRRPGRLMSRHEGGIELGLDAGIRVRTSVLTGPVASRSAAIAGELSRLADAGTRDGAPSVLIVPCAG